MKTIGFIVNPIAGMGGAVGLKGTDGKFILKKAYLLGAKPISPKRAKSFLTGLEPEKERVRIITGAGIMGEDEARNHGFALTTLGKEKKETTAEDTKELAKRIKDSGVDLLIFCGGDGTARDILDSVSLELPVLGVPTGVKMHSSVFAVGPLASAKITIEFLHQNLPLREAEVMDVDEEAYRKGRLSAKLYGYLLTPYEPNLIQGAKIASPMTKVEMYNQAAIALYIIEEMKANLIYLIGPGTTTRTIGDLLDEKKTLLGADIFCNKKIIAKDVNEEEILKRIKGKDVKIILTPIGGQGFIFGRGNQQFSPAVIRQVGLNNIIIVATEYKIGKLKSLRVDTGSPDLDDEIRGYAEVITDYKKKQMVKIE
ncbi:MAG: ATP-NAD kinase family protein [Candidatus Methylarchaceae archaeon HK02M2]|nr:ATP-NAD kinase family protein [Candidatus Methylarchaceae archaeon HK02M2]